MLSKNLYRTSEWSPLPLMFFWLRHLHPGLALYVMGDQTKTDLNNHKMTNTFVVFEYINLTFSGKANFSMDDNDSISFLCK